MFTPLRIGIFASTIAVGMIVAQIAGYDWFIVQIGSFRFALWILVAIYAGLQLLIWRTQRKHLALSDKEVAKWGDKLEVATPDILEMYRERRPVADIAKALDANHGIPQDVTLRYIIALAHHARAMETEAAGPEPSA
ncbi:MAG: hypothetical protein ACI9MR_003175 [Myxococcota bacterium]|jgi:hypothetical protein